MDKEWVEKRNKENEQKYEELKNNLYKEIKTSIYLNESKRQAALQHCEDEDFFRVELAIQYRPGNKNGRKEEPIKWQESLNLDFLMAYRKNTYNRYLDSEPMEFDGDIIITDPCYICKEKEEIGGYPFLSDFLSYNSEAEYPDCREMTQNEINRLDPLSKILIALDPKKRYASKQYKEEKSKYEEAIKKYNQDNVSDWEVCNYGYDMDKLGITHYMTRDTLYGDWSCTTYDLNTKEKIGDFCADAGMVSVLALDEVLKYNPGFDYHEKRTWTTTWIKNFKGTVQFIVTKDSGVDEENHPWEDYSVEVIGHGIDKITGNPIDFIGTQTGL